MEYYCILAKEKTVTGGMAESALAPIWLPRDGISSIFNSLAIDSIRNPPLNNHLGTIIGFPGEVSGLELMAMGNSKQNERHGQGLAVDVARPKLKRPPMYRVLLVNDDFTPMEFVVHILQTFFAMNQEKATQIMLHVHTRGKGVCGVYTHDVAETKVGHVNVYSRKHEHPLLCTMEET